MSLNAPSHPSWNPPCPWLPEVSEIHNFQITRRYGQVKGAEFYLDALRYAQSQWLGGKPAQALLQINKSWMADLMDGDSALQLNPPPYRALVWILKMAAAGDRGFMGNPVRHFQHLASRIAGEWPEVRRWRAWWCFHLAENTLPPGKFSRDGVQIAREGLWIPGPERVYHELVRHGWPGEAAVAHAAMISPPATTG